MLVEYTSLILIFVFGLTYVYGLFTFMFFIMTSFGKQKDNLCAIMQKHKFFSRVFSINKVSKLSYIEYKHFAYMQFCVMLISAISSVVILSYTFGIELL